VPSTSKWPNTSCMPPSTGPRTKLGYDRQHHYLWQCDWRITVFQEIKGKEYEKTTKKTTSSLTIWTFSKEKGLSIIIYSFLLFISLFFHIFSIFSPIISLITFIISFSTSYLFFLFFLFLPPIHPNLEYMNLNIRSQFLTNKKWFQ